MSSCDQHALPCSLSLGEEKQEKVKEKLGDGAPTLGPSSKGAPDGASSSNDKFASKPENGAAAGVSTAIAGKGAGNEKQTSPGRLQVSVVIAGRHSMLARLWTSNC